MTQVSRSKRDNVGIAGASSENEEMSAGFGIGLTRQFCPTAPLAARQELLQALVAELGLPRLLDFIHPDENPDPAGVWDRKNYRILETTPQATRWLSEEEAEVVQNSVGVHWSDSGSYSDCYLLCDEETSLVIADVTSSRLNRQGKLCLSTPLPGHQGVLVVKEAHRALADLQARSLDPELDPSDSARKLMQRGQELFEACCQHNLPSFFAWPT